MDSFYTVFKLTKSTVAKRSEHPDEKRRFHASSRVPTVDTGYPVFSIGVTLSNIRVMYWTRNVYGLVQQRFFFYENVTLSKSDTIP